ncbi:Ger(x)C family spore germination protein [Tumebacillus algifaecis]|nr:Ger(x)C family spore germination protein [Tumebacillus algifaecis]
MRVHSKLIKLMPIFLLVNLICGCWDIKEIESINYVTGIGIDYVDQHFVLYAQMIDFTNVAKTETGKSDKPAQVWIGKTKGKTLKQAMNRLYSSMQGRTSWSHISCIIMSENALRTDFLTSTDAIGRYQEIRLTPWIFGTKEPLDQILTTPAFFNVSPLNTVSHEPVEDYKQRSYIAPTQFVKLTAQLTEPATTILLPSLSINRSTWKKNEQKEPKLFVDGAYAMSEGKLIGLLNNKKLTGLRWVEQKTKESFLAITKNGEDAAVLSLEHPKVRKSMKIVNGKPKFQLHIKLNGNVNEVYKEVTREELEKIAAEVVRTEVVTTFQNGLKINSDPYRLEHLLFKHKTGVWKRLKSSGDSLLNEHSLDSVTVKINLDHFGLKILPLK